MYSSTQNINKYRSGGAVAIPNAYRLSELEEVVGDLHCVEVTDIGLIAIIGKISVWLPEDLEETLKGLIGRRVGVLRLDGYHIRCLSETDPRELPMSKREDDMGTRRAIIPGK